MKRIKSNLAFDLKRLIGQFAGKHFSLTSLRFGFCFAHRTASGLASAPDTFPAFSAATIPSHPQPVPTSRTCPSLATSRFSAKRFLSSLVNVLTNVETLVAESDTLYWRLHWLRLRDFQAAAPLLRL